MKPEDFDKRGKSQGREIDISNGALFLRIEQLEREVKYLKSKVSKLEDDSHDPVKHNIRIGSSS